MGKTTMVSKSMGKNKALKPSGTLTTKKRKQDTTHVVKKTHRKACGSSFVKSVTNTHVESFGNGKTRTTEEKHTTFAEEEFVQEEIFSVKNEMLTAEKLMFEQDPAVVIQKNPYLKQRQLRVMESCKAFSAWGNYAMRSAGFISEARPAQLVGDGFLAMCSWETCYEYGILMYKMDTNDCEEGEILPSEAEFINSYLTARYVDKLLMNHFRGQFETRTAGVWPVCTSQPDDVVEVEWMTHKMKVVRGLSFTFPCHGDDVAKPNPVPIPLRGLVLRPPYLYFPLDLLLLDPTSKKVMQEQIASDRLFMLKHIKRNPGFMSYNQDKQRIMNKEEGL